MLLEWNDSYKIGVDKIDAQHKALFDAVNKLHDAAQQGKSKLVIDETLDFLGKYVIEHFAAEEQLQQKYAYPAFKEHKAEHEKFIANFKETKAAIEADKTKIIPIINATKSTADWLRNHVLKVDMEVGKFLKDKQ
jgi:hemerythrin-like metal-binding protein